MMARLPFPKGPCGNKAFPKYCPVQKLPLFGQGAGALKPSFSKGTKKNTARQTPCGVLAGMAGLEPAECRSQSPVPYRLGYIPMWRRPQRGKMGGTQGVRPPRKMGWVNGFEPSASRATIWRSNQLSYTHRIIQVARPKGLEPLAHCLEGSCSIHLSYRRMWSG